MVLTNYPLSSFAVCVGAEARAANKQLTANYNAQEQRRKHKWMNSLSLTGMERVQYAQTLDASHVGLGNAYADIQEKYRQLVGGNLQQDLADQQKYLKESEGAQAAASGHTGRSIQRMETLDFADYLKKCSQAVYDLTQARSELSNEGAKAAAAAKQAQLAAFAKNAMWKDPGLATPPPIYKDVGAAAFRDTLGIVSSVGAIAAPIVGGMIAAGSDRRLKENIQKIGESISGINIYKFNYIGKVQKYIGAMADEVQKIKPEAVVKMDNGFLGIIYDQIDVNFKEAY